MKDSVGNGQSVLALRDPWVPTLARFRPMIREMLLMDSNSLKVSDFLLEGGLRLDSIHIQRLFYSRVR